jgi:glycosyltransferase involved in cell wall biosynthesis
VLQRLASAWLRVSPRRYSLAHSLALSWSFARTVSRRLSKEKVDVIFAPAASTEIACLTTRIPIIYLSDTTFGLLHDYYFWLSDLCRLSVWEGHRVERSAIARARALIYSTEWAARSAERDYGARRERIHVIPFGANLEVPADAGAPRERRGGAFPRMLFLGTDWRRKGGDIALDTLRALDRFGVKATLTVCGSAPPRDESHERLTVVPFLDMNVEGDRRRLTDHMRDSDLLLLPTRADCSPIVFSEANGFCLPVVSTDTGGVSGVVRDGENGLLLPLEAGGEEYAIRIRDLVETPGRYESICRASRRAFEERLNWDAWARRMKDVISSLT